jgi:hypothetical protein
MGTHAGIPGLLPYPDRLWRTHGALSNRHCEQPTLGVKVVRMRTWRITPCTAGGWEGIQFTSIFVRFIVRCLINQTRINFSINSKTRIQCEWEGCLDQRSGKWQEGAEKRSYMSQSFIIWELQQVRLQWSNKGTIPWTGTQTNDNFWSKNTHGSTTYFEEHSLHTWGKMLKKNLENKTWGWIRMAHYLVRFCFFQHGNFP